MARNVIYFDSPNTTMAGLVNLSYTDVIVAFLVVQSSSNLNLVAAGGASEPNFQADIQALKNAGKNVLISFGGADFPSLAYQNFAHNVDGLVQQIVNFVTSHGFNGVDIDYEDNNGFTGVYNGVGFLIGLTSGLAKALPGTSLPMPHKHRIGTQTGNTAVHTSRYGSKWVIRSRGSTINSTTTQAMMTTPLPRYPGMRRLPPLQGRKNFWWAPLLAM
jgi:Glycosyl hydrolases family 18